VSLRRWSLYRAQDRDGQEDHAFGIDVDIFVTEEGRESISLPLLFEFGSDIAIIAEVSQTSDIIYEMYCELVQVHLHE
jgi:hypothetical protein